MAPPVARWSRRDPRAFLLGLARAARPEDRTRALRAGYQAHLVKPVNPAELIATVASFADLIDSGGSEDRN